MTDGPPRAALIAAIGIAVAAVVAVLVIALTRQQPVTDEQPLAIPAVPAPQSASAECQALLAALPQQLGDYQRAMIAEPAPPGTAAWQPDSAEEPVVLRCGVPPPADFVVGAAIQVVNGVQWFQAPDVDEARSTWLAVDRPVYVALTLPSGSGSAPIQLISNVVAQTMATMPIRPGPPR